MSRALVEPLSPGRYKVRFTASAELHAQIERLRALMGYQIPDGDLAAIIGHAVSETLARLEARRFAKTSAPRKSLSDTDTAPASRHLPAAVRSCAGRTTSSWRGLTTVCSPRAARPIRRPRHRPLELPLE